VNTKYAPLFGFLLSSAVLVCGVRARADDAPAGAFKTPIAADNLDPAAFVQASGASETALAVKEGPRQVLWTRDTAPEWDGVRFGESKEAGPRLLRVGFKAAVPVGAVLTRGGGALSVLKPAAGYPGRLADDADWIPAERLKGARVCRDEVGEDEYAVWVLPPGTVTRALRFTHTAAAFIDDGDACAIVGILAAPERIETSLWSFPRKWTLPPSGQPKAWRMAAGRVKSPSPVPRATVQPGGFCEGRNFCINPTGCGR
jgi:hypothetical protein